MEVYKKSYKGLIVWMLFFIAMFFSVELLPTNDITVITYITNNIMTIQMAILTYIIYKNEKIYWYSGVEFEDAKKATSRQRKEYAFKHFKRFGLLAVAYLVYSVIAYYLGVHYGVSMAIGIAGIVIVAISTIWIKLETA